MQAKFEDRKSEIQKQIDEIEQDIRRLTKNLEKCKIILESAQSLEDFEKYKDFNVESGLKHIELF